MEKVRNHYIARLLLNRFASRVIWGKKKKCWIWQVGKDNIPAEVNTRKTAFAKYFYGRPETGVEDAFEKIETRFAYILRALDSCDRLDNYHQELNHILWLFYTRTRALRENLGDSLEGMLGLIPDLANTDQFQDQVIERVKQQFRDPAHIELLAQRLPLEKRAQFINIMRNPDNQTAMAQVVDKFVTMLDCASLSETFVDRIKKENIISKTAKEAHVKALSNMMKEEKTPLKFTPSKWELLESAEQTFILGDSCMFAVTRYGLVDSILRAAKDWKVIYFPISSSQVLVAFRDKKTSLLPLEDINQASAEVSYSYIYASKVDTLMKFSEFIGTRASLFTPEDAAILKAQKI